MDKKVVIVKTIDEKKEKVGYIKKENIKDIYMDLYYCDTFKTLVKIENMFANNNASYNLEAEEYEDIALENFNRKLNNLDKIKGYDNLDVFLRTYASNLVTEVSDERIRTSLISLSQGDNLKEKEVIIRKLYKLTDDYWTQQLINENKKPR